jgi:molybdopterin-guanine dinucleotide biosynthesis protein A
MTASRNPAPAGPELAGLILAGGLSSRMGGGIKGLRLLAGKPMLAHVIARVAPQLGRLAVNANAPGCEGFGLPVLADTVAGHPGPLAGILAGLGWAEATGADWLLTAPGDAPFLPRDLVARLRAASDGERPVMARSASGLQPVVGLWPTRLGPGLADWLARGCSRRVQDWAFSTGAVICEVPDPGDGPEAFFNVNTAEDLAEAERWLAGSGGQV